MSELSVKHLLGIKDLNKPDIELVFKLATDFKEVINRPIKKVPTLRDKTIANLFFENSTRTKLSFELAEKRLSADVINFSASASSVSKGESLIDTVNNILAMKVDMVVMRHPSPGAAHFLAKNTNSTVINAGDGTHEHPTQALLDAFSLQQKFGKLNGKKITIVGDILHSRVAMSNIQCLLKLGANVEVCGPPTLIPLGIESMGVTVSHKMIKSVVNSDAMMMLRIQLERQSGGNYFPSTREYINNYCLNSDILTSARRKDLIIMHPGPINRGVEISSELADSHNSIILEQVENGVAVRMAILYLLSKS